MGCATCGNNNTIRIGTGDYCQTCGTRIGTKQERTAVSARRSMDIGRPRRNQPQVSPRLAQKAIVSGRNGGGVSDVVRPAKGGVIDLRAQKATLLPTSQTLHPKPAKASIVIPTEAPYVEHHQPSSEASQVHPSSGSAFKMDRFEDRFDRAKKTGKSATVSKFSHPFDDAPSQSHSSMADQTVTHHNEMPPAAAAHHEALSQLINRMPPVNIPSATSRNGRIAAVAGAIVIMGAYVWLQNYPKLAIRSAGSKAGIAASMPSYVPTSFTLARTTSQPGLVTLSFKGSDNQTLSIAQHRTDWDSRSLLDNFVSQQNGDYTPVDGQGLTVYLGNDNQATWVNHGVWYRITGATRLSREQILKIAYGL